MVEDIRESFSQGGSEEGAESAERISYELPDRHVIEVEKSEVPDLFVYPEESEYKGIANMVADTINSSDVDVKKEFYSNILLSGRYCLIQGEICYWEGVLD